MFQILVYFISKNFNPPWKSHHFFPSKPSKSWGSVKPPSPFENLVGGTIPKQKGHTMLLDLEICKQHDEAATGSPLGPIIASVFLCYLEKNWLQSLPSEFKPLIYWRYVDDAFLHFLLKHYIHKPKKVIQSSTIKGIRLADPGLARNGQRSPAHLSTRLKTL